MTKYIGKIVGLLKVESRMNVSIHEDNYRALILEKTFSPQFTPQSRLYYTKTIWFFEEIAKREINLCKINTVDQ